MSIFSSFEFAQFIIPYLKVLKRNAYGYKNFKRFRNRILHMFSHQQGNEQAAA